MHPNQPEAMKTASMSKTLSSPLKSLSRNTYLLKVDQECRPIHRCIPARTCQLSNSKLWHIKTTCNNNSAAAIPCLHKPVCPSNKHTKHDPLLERIHSSFTIDTRHVIWTLDQPVFSSSELGVMVSSHLGWAFLSYTAIAVVRMVFSHFPRA